MNAIYSNYSPSFLFVDQYEFSAQWVSKAFCPYSMLRYICSGSAVFSVNEVEYTVKVGDVFYIPEGSRLLCKALEKISFISIRFYDSVKLPDTDMLRHLWNIQQLYHCQDNTNLLAWFRAAYKSALSHNLYKRLQIRGYLNLICAELAEMSDSKGQVDEIEANIPPEMDVEYLRKRALASIRESDPRIKVLVDYLRHHPEENISQKEMANMIDISESTLRRLFKQEMGKSVFDFVNENKMVLACHLLVTSNITISELCYKLGYESPSYFTKRFRENFGVSPSVYRKNAKEA